MLAPKAVNETRWLSQPHRLANVVLNDWRSRRVNCITAAGRNEGKY